MIAPRLALLAVLGAVTAAGVSGCAPQNSVDDKDFTGEAGRVANTIRELDDAYVDEQNDDGGARNACRSLLSKRLVAALGGKDCAKGAKAALDNADTTQMDVREIKIEGDVATAKVRLKLDDDEQRVDTLKLVQENRSWKFDGSATGQKTPDK